jgi:DNA-binding transcriptional ArsR family regulator
LFTDIFGNAPRVRLLDFLADHPDFDYTISQMAEFADIARPTIYKLVAELLGKDMLIFTRSVGDSKFYRLNVANPRIVSMLQVDLEGINKELAAGVYDEMSGAATEPGKSRAGGRSRDRLSRRERMVPVRAYPRRAVRRKGPKSSD